MVMKLKKYKASVLVALGRDCPGVGPFLFGRNAGDGSRVKRFAENVEDGIWRVAKKRAALFGRKSAALEITN
jgi:hypothetical protein